MCSHIVSVADCMLKSFIGLRWFKFYGHFYEKEGISTDLQADLDADESRFPKHCYLHDDEINQILSN